MECFIFKVTLNESHNCADSASLEEYLLNNYTRETFFERNSSSNNPCISFEYLHNELLYSIVLMETTKISETDFFECSDNGTCIPSTVYKVIIGDRGVLLDIHDYTGSAEELNTLVTRMAALSECGYEDEKNSLAELDDWITTNSKSYTLNDMMTLSEDQYSNDDFSWGPVDSFYGFSQDIGTWITSHIDGNLSSRYSIAEFIAKYKS